MTDYEMYTAGGQVDVDREVEKLVARMRHPVPISRRQLPEAVRAMCDDLALLHPEVYDTEPQYAIADRLSEVCKELGWLPIERWEW